jgi:hypothetical protein
MTSRTLIAAVAALLMLRPLMADRVRPFNPAGHGKSSCFKEKAIMATPFEFKMP